MLRSDCSGPFALSLPGETRFGIGRLAELPELAVRFGTRVALVHGRASYTGNELGQRVDALLAGLNVTALPPQTREPAPEDVDAAVAVARRCGAEVIIAIGGGSVLDLGKAVAAVAPQEDDVSVIAYLEGVGDGRQLLRAPLPVIAVPTTAGTGTEASANAVITSQQAQFKKSLRDRRMLPAVALIDPELARLLPPHLTAWCGLDALTQLIESFTSCRAQPVTDALAWRGLVCAQSLRDAVNDGQNLTAREHMAFAAYLSGVCLANAGLGAAHAIAAALGSITALPHGLACAMALPWVMAANLPVVADRYAQVAAALGLRTTGDCTADARSAIAYCWDLLRDVGIPRVAEIPEVAAVLADEQLPAVAARCHGNSLRGNPRPLSDHELVDLLRAMRDRSAPCADAPA